MSRVRERTQEWLNNLVLSSPILQIRRSIRLTRIETKIVAEPALVLEERISDEGRRIARAGRIVYDGET